jgi:hypothetical protein
MTVTKIQAASTLMDLSGAFVMVDLQEIQLFAKVKNPSIIAPAVVQQGQFPVMYLENLLRHARFCFSC